MYILQVPPPDDVVSSLPVPSTDSISFHPVIVLANHNVGGASDQLVGGVSEASNRFPVQNLPFFLQFNHIHSKFVEVSFNNCLITSHAYFSFRQFWIRVVCLKG